jgi:hypothetical protein
MVLFLTFIKGDNMKYILAVLLFIITSLSFAQEKDSANVKEETVPETTKPHSTESKWYYGGEVGFAFSSNYFSIGVDPLVGYKVTPKLSLGAKIGYTYISDDRYEPLPALNSSNYGGSIFSRYRIIPQLYAHAEFAYWSYENAYGFTDDGYETERVWVPFLLLGGGFSQMISPNVWAYAEVLFDVLNDSNSPYDEWDPFISVGVGVGF